MFRTFLYSLILVLVLTSCIQDANLNFDDPVQKKYTLNCILDDARDTLTAWLSQSHRIGLNERFAPVINAGIKLFENDSLVGQFTWQDSSAYQLQYIPVKGKTYRIEAEIGTKKIWAETQMPGPIPGTLTEASVVGYWKSCQVILQNDRKLKNNYWITATGYEHFIDGVRKNIAGSLLSNVSYADDFNRRIAPDPEIIRFEYSYYIHLIGAEIPEQVNLTVTPQSIELPMKVFLLSVDSNLDKYMKSSLVLEDMNKYVEDSPISYSPFPVYSNIHGGVGIFGAMTGIFLDYEKKQTTNE